MADVMMAIGDFQFAVDTAPYNSIKRTSSYKWQEQDRIGNRAAYQYNGIGADTITLSGCFYPQVTGRYGTMNDLRKIAETGKPQLLVDGMGNIFGLYAIKSIEDGSEVFFQGGMPRKVDFTVQLEKTAEKRTVSGGKVT